MRCQLDLCVRISGQDIGHDGADAVRQIERLALVGAYLRLQGDPAKMLLAAELGEPIGQQRVQIEAEGIPR